MPLQNPSTRGPGIEVDQSLAHDESLPRVYQKGRALIRIMERAFTVMLNHAHGIIFIYENNITAANSFPPVASGLGLPCIVYYV